MLSVSLGRVTASHGGCGGVEWLTGRRVPPADCARAAGAFVRGLAFMLLASTSPSHIPVCTDDDNAALRFCLLPVPHGLGVAPDSMAALLPEFDTTADRFIMWLDPDSVPSMFEHRGLYDVVNAAITDAWLGRGAETAVVGPSALVFAHDVMEILEICLRTIGGVAGDDDDADGARRLVFHPHPRSPLVKAAGRPSR